MSASTQDLQASFDPTAYASISGAQLLQLITGALPSTDKGLVLATNDSLGVPDVPDASENTGNPKWQNYIWLRVGSTVTTPYIWNNQLGDQGTLKKWYSIAQSSIGPGAVTNLMLATNSVSSDKILSLDGTKITNYILPAVMTASGAVVSTATPGGDLAGVGSTYAVPVILAGSITSGKLGLEAVIDSKVERATSSTTGIDVAAIRGNSTIGNILRSDGDYTTSWITPNNIVASTSPASDGTNDGQCVVVNSGAAGTFSYINTSLVGEVSNLLVVAGADVVHDFSMTANSVVVGNTNGATRVVSMTSSVVVAIDGSGIDGLDTGVADNNKWYYLWVIYNPASGLVHGVWSLATAWAAVTKPAGYTYGALVSCTYYTASAVTQCRQVNKHVEIAPVQIISGAAGTTSWTALTIPESAVPPIAKSIKGAMGSSTNNIVRIAIAATTAGYGACYYSGGVSGATALDSFYQVGSYNVHGATLAAKMYDTNSYYRVTVTGYSI